MVKLYDRVEIVGMIEDEILALGTVPYRFARDAKQTAYRDQVTFRLLLEFMTYPNRRENVLRRLEAHLKREGVL